MAAMLLMLLAVVVGAAHDEGHGEGVTQLGCILLARAAAHVEHCNALAAGLPAFSRRVDVYADGWNSDGWTLQTLGSAPLPPTLAQSTLSCSTARSISLRVLDALLAFFAEHEKRHASSRAFVYVFVELCDSQDEAETVKQLVHEKFIELFAAYPTSADVVLVMEQGRANDALLYLGNPRFDQHVGDMSGFQMAATLAKLIHQEVKEEANSLQAHVLSKGHVFRVVDVSDVTDASVLLLLDLPTSARVRVREEEEEEGRGGDTRAGVGVLLPEASHCGKLRGRDVMQLEVGTSEQFVERAVASNQPLVVKNSVVTTWPAMTAWANLSYFLSGLDVDELADVKVTSGGRTFDPDMTSALANATNWTLPYSVVNMSISEFEHAITQDNISIGYFSDISRALHTEARPDELLYLTSDDWMYRRQFVWVQTRGAVTHTHFDQDYNIFVQVVGRKRFTLYPVQDSPRMHMYPRIHPLWHKSRLDPCAPNTQRFADFDMTDPYVVTLEPGDVLFIPPYVWHHVETLTSPSIALSTLSHDDATRETMELIYVMDHKFDRLAEQQGQIFALRLYLDMLINELVGHKQVSRFLEDLLQERYAGLELLFEDRADICTGVGEGIPTAQHVYGDCTTDMKLVSASFRRIESLAVRDILLKDYVEELIAQVAGPQYVVAFVRNCFKPLQAGQQQYYLTKPGDGEHEQLWEYYSRDEN